MLPDTGLDASTCSNPFSITSSRSILSFSSMISRFAVLLPTPGALVALGYSATEASKVLSGIEITEDSDVERVLKAALKNMAFL